MIQLDLFDMTQPKTPYEANNELMVALRHAFTLFYEDAMAYEPHVTGRQFPVKLPDGRRMVVQMRVQD